MKIVDVDEDTLLFSAHHLMRLYICTKFCGSILKGFLVTDPKRGADASNLQMLGWSQFTKGNNSIKSLGGHTDVVLCILSDDALYLYHFS